MKRKLTDKDVLGRYVIPAYEKAALPADALEVLAHTPTGYFKGHVKASKKALNDALSFAAEDGELALVLALLALGAEMQTPVDALYGAVTYGHTEIVQLLLARGARTDKKDTVGNTPFYEAVSHGHREIIALLLEKGANVNARNKVGSTALHKAAELVRFDMIRLLIEHGARTDIKDDYGKTPLDYATQCKNDRTLLLINALQAIAALQPSGGKVFQEDGYSYT